jgi:hypothetical protein
MAAALRADARAAAKKKADRAAAKKEGIKEESLEEAKPVVANRLKYDATDKQWYHSPNGGFTWKRVTSDEAKKAYAGKHKDISAEHGLKEETLDEMKTVTNRSHGKSYHIEINGSKNLCKQYSFGHYPFMGPLNKTCHATKTELKKALQAHPYYNTSLREETLDEMSWTKQVQYADAAKKDRLDKFHQSLATSDPAEKASLEKRIANRTKTINKVMANSGWNRKPVKEEVFTSDKQPVIVPAERNDDGSAQPAKTVMRRVRKKILGTGNVHDGK